MKVSCLMPRGIKDPKTLREDAVNSEYNLLGCKQVINGHDDQEIGVCWVYI